MHDALKDAGVIILHLYIPLVLLLLRIHALGKWLAASFMRLYTTRNTYRQAR